jgi:RHS repeat-associated protein
MREKATVESGGVTTTRTSVWDGAQLVAERDSDGTVYRYLWGPDRTPLALEVVSPSGTSTLYDYHTDAAGSVVALTNESGEVVASYRYDAFGALTDIGGSDAWLAGRNPLRYRAYYADDETGLYYLPARYYEPATARFLSPDPAPPSAGDPLSLNAYAYCQGDPVNASDPSGAITDYDGNGKVDSWDSSMSAAEHTSDWQYAAVFRKKARQAYSRAIDLETRRAMAKARLEMTLSYRASQEWSSAARFGLGVGGAVLYAAGMGLTSDGLIRVGRGASIAFAGLAGSPEPTPAGEAATATGAGIAALGAGEWLLGTVFQSTGSDLIVQACTGKKADLWVTSPVRRRGRRQDWGRWRCTGTRTMAGPHLSALEKQKEEFACRRG